MRICETCLVGCDVCGFLGKGVLYYGKSLTCPECGDEWAYIPDTPHFGEAPGLKTDDIPGGIEIRHGLVNPDGSARKFYSKTDIKRAANEKGLTWADDSPQPYRVPWSGKRDDKKHAE